MIKTLINPPTLAQPRGYNHAVRAWPVGRLLFLSGQVGWTADEKFVSRDVLGQFSQALANLQIAVKAGGGRMDDIVQMRIFVTDMAGYKKAAGFAIETLNKAKRTIAEGMRVRTAQAV